MKVETWIRGNKCVVPSEVKEIKTLVSSRLRQERIIYTQFAARQYTFIRNFHKNSTSTFVFVNLIGIYFLEYRPRFILIRPFINMKYIIKSVQSARNINNNI